MANWSNPTLTSLYTDFVTEVKNRDVDLALGLDPATTSPTNVPTGSIRWNSASFKYQKWDGTTWNDLSAKYIFTSVEVSGTTVPVNGMYLSTTNTLNFSTASTASRLTIDASGNVNIDSGTFYVDAVNNRVGVGTATPGSSLELSGSGSACEMRLRSTDTTNAIIRAYVNSLEAGKIAFTSGRDLFIETAGSERLRLDASGNLGLGVVPNTWSATARALQFGNYGALYQNASGYPELAFNTYQNTSNVFTYRNTDVATRYSQTNGQHQWFTAPSGTAGAAITFTQAMTLDASGRLGIATSSPGALLDISGSGNIVRLGDGTNTHDVRFKGPNNWSVQLNTSTDVFSVQRNSVPFVNITGAGNLGLGTDNPIAKLHVSNGGAAGIEISPLTAFNGPNIQAYNRSGAAYVPLDFSASSFFWYLSGSQKMQLDSSGRLLVGTSSTSDSAKFLMQGNAVDSGGGAIINLCNGKATPVNGEATGIIRFSDNTHAEAVTIMAARDGGTWSASSKPTRLVFSTTADGAATPTERMRIDNAGNIKYAWANNGFAGFYFDATYYQGITNGATTRELLIDCRSNDTRADIVFRTGLNTGVAERLRIDNTGRLLHIGGGSAASPAVQFNGSAPSDSLVVGSGGAISTTASVASITLNGTNTSGLIQRGGQVIFTGKNAAGTQKTAAYISADLSTTTSTQEGGDLSFFTMNPGGTGTGTSATIEAMRLNKNGTASFLGNAGNISSPIVEFSGLANAGSLLINSSGYITSNSGRVPAMQFYRLNAGLAGSNVNTAQSALSVGVTLTGSTVYAFEGLFLMTKTTGTTGHTIGTGFGGTATINNIGYNAQGTVWSTNPTTGNYGDLIGTSVTPTAVTQSQSTATAFAVIKLVGTVSINAGGTFIPQYILSSAPGGAYTMVAGSYFSIWPLGASGANTSIGNWA